MLPGFALLERLDAAVYAVSPNLAPALHALGIAVLLGPPTLAMGATVPVFAQIARTYRISVAALYGMNTLGASAGAGLIAFVLVPALGVSSTCQVIALLNLAVFATTWLVTARDPQSSREADPRVESPRVPAAVAGTVVFFTGWVTFGLEIAWFRALRAAFGSITDSFAIMLTAVLLALGIGARLVPWLRKTRVRPGAMLLLAGIGILIATPLVERMDLFAVSDLAYGAQLGWRFLLVLATLGPPMLLLGMVLPWLLAEFGDPWRCGRLYGINTLGAVFGSLFAAWVLLPWLGFARSAWLMGSLIVVVAAAISTTRGRILAVASGGVALAVAMTWTSSLGRDRVLGITGDDIERIVAFDEGPDSTVSVVSVDDGFAPSRDRRIRRNQRALGRRVLHAAHGTSSHAATSQPQERTGHLLRHGPDGPRVAHREPGEPRYRRTQPRGTGDGIPFRIQPQRAGRRARPRDCHGRPRLASAHRPSLRRHYARADAPALCRCQRALFQGVLRTGRPKTGAGRCRSPMATPPHHATVVRGLGSCGVSIQLPRCHPMDRAQRFFGNPSRPCVLHGAPSRRSMAGPCAKRRHAKPQPRAVSGRHCTRRRRSCAVRRTRRAGERRQPTVWPTDRSETSWPMAPA